jgi:hypothetical protein
MTNEQFTAIIQQLSAIAMELSKLNINICKIGSAQTQQGNRKSPPPTSVVDPTTRPG